MNEPGLPYRVWLDPYAPDQTRKRAGMDFLRPGGREEALAAEAEHLTAVPIAGGKHVTASPAGSDRHPQDPPGGARNVTPSAPPGAQPKSRSARGT